jgi:hypothetical protein
VFSGVCTYSAPPEAALRISASAIAMLGAMDRPHLS